MLNMVKERFNRIAVVLNVGGIVDVSWIKMMTGFQPPFLAGRGNGRRAGHGRASSGKKIRLAS